MAKIASNTGVRIFVVAPGGTGQAFILNLILAKIRSSGGIALATTSSGIAATLLNGGRTLHSTFKIPLKLSTSGGKTCNTSKSTDFATVFREAIVIIIDEARMT